MTQLAEKADLDALAKWAQKQGLKTVAGRGVRGRRRPAGVQARTRTRT